MSMGHERTRNCRMRKGESTDDRKQDSGGKNQDETRDSNNRRSCLQNIGKQYTIIPKGVVSDTL